MHLTRAFLSGLTSEQDCEVHEFVVKDKRIEFCQGCFHCWNNAEGKCVFDDDMTEFLSLYRSADLVIFSMPVYTFGMPARVKNLLDRMLPTHAGTITSRKDGGERHVSRWDDDEKKVVVISTCGFYSYENNVEAFVKIFEILYGDRCEKIICPEGPIFSLTVLEKDTDFYIQAVRKAGAEFARTGALCEATRESLVQRTFGKASYLELANNYWVNATSGMTPEEKKKLELQNILRQMRVLVDESLLTEDRTVIEFVCPDVDFAGQLALSKPECAAIVDRDAFLPWHLRIVTTADSMIGISRERRSEETASESPAKGMARVNRLVKMAVQLSKKGHSKEINYSA